ncbi:fungal-specific transcription factor domain-containing protein [Roridomyces roridus]|uniref:Fungal-specific transcription factor domain-containing protein n=1 Tax=Roridomyces roridus TaxID=1738132 RepID=A0AAD7BSI6_9AGAR|nr:fungal-specific transcription factor domain-containing protein [Roridomyces roridus]
MSWPAGTPVYTLPFADYDDDEIEDDQPPTASGKDKDRLIRRRSSKACDQCRKAKCKCERSSNAPGAACRACVLVGTECTFLGPSRKRGPPKGYIDAIEARLHQTEALVGILLSAARGDARARSVLHDLGEDPLARAIITRIDHSAYGPAGRVSSRSRTNSPRGHPRNSASAATDVEHAASTHPSHEWMDRVTAHMLRRAREARRPTRPFEGSSPARREGSQQGFSAGEREQHFRDSQLISQPLPPQRALFRSGPPSSGGSFHSGPHSRAGSPGAGSEADRESDVDVDMGHVTRDGDGSTPADDSGLAGAVGQLSLNEDKQVRYHGKVSGLHLLARRAAENGNGHEQGQEDKEELGKNVGGIWRFPKARVWPAAPSPDRDDDEGEVGPDGLPPRATQEALLARYFTHVHPSFPVVHKAAVLDGVRSGAIIRHPECSILSRTPRPPPLLLLVMYALAARHAPQPPGPARTKYMWPAGDAFLFRAKALLDSSYASSRASTCAALLLMGFREIGIGAMAQAWIYIGMAVRMAQDLGLHRDADGWARVGKDDGKLFSPWEIAERRRIWYACVIMDKYVSTYIGRPLAICERDFDTSLPSENDVEEMEQWPGVGADAEDLPVSITSRPGHIISCFNASARVSIILSQIVQSIYALRPAASRHAELIVLDEQLEKWLLALPAHLRHDPAVRTSGEVPLPHVLTLHMQYWCAALLLHRPFSSPGPEEGDVRGNAEKSYELCAAAANHITTIAVLYADTYTLKHCPVFHCYYIFTASIMHVTSLSAHPSDPQARMGLTKCMDALREMEIIWPAAARALELLRGAQATLANPELVSNNTQSIRRKRSATQSLEDRPFVPSSSQSGPENFVAVRPYVQVYQPNGHYGMEQPRSSYYPQPPSPYERWQSESAPGPMGAGALAYQGTVSTAVMGPAYSTGLVEERSHRVAPQEGEPRYEHQQQQFWGEYAFPHVGSGYSAGLAVHHPGEQQMYGNTMQDQYNMYSHQ